MNELLECSAVELAQKIRNHDVSPAEVLETYIDRVRAINPQLNALVVDLFREARQRAQQQSETLAERDVLPLFFGVPISIKEMISVEDQPITCGSVYREDTRSTADADVVENVKESGAIPIGLTNVPELGLWIESSNPVYGTTRNPHDPDRTAGGSSGGEAALIAAQASPMGIGSDMGGSIRIPATFCGIYGHKPSATSVSVEGHFPHEHSPRRHHSIPKSDLVSIGPITRHASDLLPLYNVLRSRQPSPDDPPARASEVVNFSDMTVYLLPDPEISLARSTSSEVSESVERAGRALAERGATLRSFPTDFFEKATGIYLTNLENMEMPSVEELSGMEGPFGVTGELARKVLSSSRHTLPMLTLCLVDKVFSPSETDVEKALHLTERLREELNDYLEPGNVLIMPTYPTRAPYHGRTLLRPFDMMYAAIFNVLDLPVTAAPVSYNNDEAPTGVQIVSPVGRDENGIGAAMALEEKLGTPGIRS